MIYDVKELQGDLHSMLDSIKKLIDENDLDSMVVVFKDKAAGEYCRYIYQGETSLFEMIGSLDVTKADLIERILYSSEL